MPSLRTEDTVFLFTQPVLGQGFSQGEFSVDLLHHGDFLPCAYYSTAENANSVWFLLLFVLVGLSGETEPIGYIYTHAYMYISVCVYVDTCGDLLCVLGSPNYGD